MFVLRNVRRKRPGKFYNSYCRQQNPQIPERPFANGPVVQTELELNQPPSQQETEKKSEKEEDRNDLHDFNYKPGQNQNNTAINNEIPLPPMPHMMNSNIPPMVTENWKYKGEPIEDVKPSNEQEKSIDLPGEDEVLDKEKPDS